MRTLMLKTDTVDDFLSGYSEIKSAISRTGEITSIATDDQNPLSAFIIAMVWLHDKEDAVTKALQSLTKGTEEFYGHLLRDVFHPLFKSLSEKATSVHIPALNTSINMAPLYFGPGKTQVNSETFASSIMSHNMKMVDNRSREKIFVSNKFTDGKFPVSCNIPSIVRTDLVRMFLLPSQSFCLCCMSMICRLLNSFLIRKIRMHCLNSIQKLCPFLQT